jgi:hypothetical protein
MSTESIRGPLFPNVRQAFAVLNEERGERIYVANRENYPPESPLPEHAAEQMSNMGVVEDRFGRVDPAACVAFAVAQSTQVPRPGGSDRASMTTFWRTTGIAGGRAQLFDVAPLDFPLDTTNRLVESLPHRVEQDDAASLSAFRRTRAPP